MRLSAHHEKRRANRLAALAVVDELDPLRPAVDKLVSIMGNLKVVNHSPGLITCLR